MKRSSPVLKLSFILVVLLTLIGSTSEPAAAEVNALCMSIADGPWNSADTWFNCGDTVPQSADTVLINSGFTVTVDLGVSPVIDNLFIISGGALELNGQTLTLTGDFDNSGTFTNSGGTMVFAGNGPQNVSGAIAFEGLTINAGSILDLGTNRSVTFVSLSNNGAIRASDSTSPYEFGIAGTLETNGATMSITTTTGDFGTITVDRYDSDHPYATGTSGGAGIRTGYYWDITATGSGTATLSLPTTVAGGTPDSRKVCKYVGPGTLWDCDGVGSGIVVTRTNVTAFSEWAVGVSVEPTVVELSGARVSSPGINWTGPVALGILFLTLIMVGFSRFALHKKSPNISLR